MKMSFHTSSVPVSLKITLIDTDEFYKFLTKFKFGVKNGVYEGCKIQFIVVGNRQTSKKILKM